MAYSELKELTDAVTQLNVKLDERVRSIEEWQAKTDLKVSQGGGIPVEGKAAVDTINAEISVKIAEYKQLLAEQKEEKLAAQRPGYAGNYGGRKHQKPAATKAIEKWLRKGGDQSILSSEERKLIDFNHMDYANMPDEQKVMISAAADLGGFFAGTDLSEKFIQKLFLISPWLALVDQETIGGEKLIIPSEGSLDTNVFWSDEQSGFQASPDANLGMLEIYAREVNGYLKLARQNLEDSVFDIEGFILKRLTRQFAQKIGTAITSGDGVARPEGITTNTSINSYTSSTASNILPKDIVQTMHVGKSGYRKTSTWAMSNNTIGVLRLFADTQNRPLWQMFGQEFVETLYGRPIVEMPDMVNPATGQVTYTTGNIPILFGDFNQGYQVVNRVGLTFQTLKELFAIQNQFAYLARMRIGGKVVLPEAITKLVIQ
jgi:HK97 family phage major capsid protein